MCIRDRPFVMGYDLHAEKMIAEKKQLLEMAVTNDWILVLDHDPDVDAIKVGRDEKGRFVVKEEIELPRVGN